jgi:hypothetical protein
MGMPLRDLPAVYQWNRLIKKGIWIFIEGLNMSMTDWPADERPREKLLVLRHKQREAFEALFAKKQLPKGAVSAPVY